MSGTTVPRKSRSTPSRRTRPEPRVTQPLSVGVLQGLMGQRDFGRTRAPALVRPDLQFPNAAGTGAGKTSSNRQPSDYHNVDPEHPALRSRPPIRRKKRCFSGLERMVVLTLET